MRRMDSSERVGLGVKAFAATIAVIATGVLGVAPAKAAPDNLGTEFWLAFPGNISANSSEKSLFITGPTPASGTVEIPGLGFSEAFTVTPGSVTTVALPIQTDLSVQEGIEAKGIHVTADQEVAVYGLNRLSATTDAYLGLPVDVLGTDNIVLGIGTGLGGTSEFGIAAAHDATTVTITPTVDSFGGRTAGVPYNVVINRGEAYQLRAQVAQTDLSGTVITSDKPISLYGGHQCANIPDQLFFACDHVVEQMAPTNTWGRSFGTVPLKTRSNGDTFRIVASQDGTDVQVNGASVATLNRGQVHQQIIQGNSTITSNNPILVGQYSNSTSFDNAPNADPFEMIIPPLEQFQNAYTVSTPASGFVTNVINVVAPDSAVGSVSIGGGNIPASEFTPIGATGFSGAQVDVPLGTHNLGGTQPFGVFSYGFGSFDSYGYAGGQSFASIASVVSISVEPPTQKHLVNTVGCVVATPKDSAGAGVPGVRVDFEVAGVNPETGFVVADDKGEARFCYNGKNLGEDTITASVGQLKGTATKSWVPSLGQCVGKEVTIDGTGEITGTEDADVISGAETNDTITGLGGDDTICGRGGDDNVSGDDGRDTLRGGKKKDRVKGGEGNDSVRGQTGRDKLSGGDGNDKLVANKGADSLKGDDGNDNLKADNGNDNLYGGPGNDKLDGGKGDNKCFPDGGENTLKNCD